MDRRELCGKPKRWHQTYSRFLRMLDGVTGRIGPDTRAEMWSRLAFLNYVSRAYALRAREQQPETAWQEANLLFESRLQAIEPLPQAIIVWDYTLRNRLIREGRFNVRSPDGCGGEMRIGAQGAVLTYTIEHPSRVMSSKRIADWNDAIWRFFDSHGVG